VSDVVNIGLFQSSETVGNWKFSLQLEIGRL
jgi:hypothetical protein